MDQQYSSEVTADHIEEVNQICGYDRYQKHVVLFREPRPWMDSIYRWGLDADWFQDEAAFLSNRLYESYFGEWDAFYAIWQKMAEQSPNQVMILSYAQLKENPSAAIEIIDCFMGVKRPEPVDFGAGVNKVRYSKPIMEERIGIEDTRIDAVIDNEENFEWRRFSPSE